MLLNARNHGEELGVKKFCRKKVKEIISEKNTT